MAAPLTAPRTSFNGTITGHRAIALADDGPRRPSRRSRPPPAPRSTTSCSPSPAARCAPTSRTATSCPRARCWPPCRSRCARSRSAPGRQQGLGAVHQARHRRRGPARAARGAWPTRNRNAKEHHKAISADSLQDWAEFAAPRTFGLAVRAYAGLRLAEKHPVVHNLVISNVPGPAAAALLHGRPDRGAAPARPGLPRRRPQHHRDVQQRPGRRRGDRLPRVDAGRRRPRPAVPGRAGAAAGGGRSGHQDVTPITKNAAKKRTAKKAPARRSQAGSSRARPRARKSRRRALTVAHRLDERRHERLGLERAGGVTGVDVVDGGAGDGAGHARAGGPAGCTWSWRLTTTAVGTSICAQPGPRVVPAERGDGLGDRPRARCERSSASAHSSMSRGSRSRARRGRARGVHRGPRARATVRSPSIVAPIPVKKTRSGERHLEPVGGRAEHQAADLVAVLAPHPLGHDRAHRVAGDDHLLELEHVDQGADVVRAVGQRELLATGSPARASAGRG